MARRVLFIDEDQERNGTTVSMEYLVRGFSQRGYEVAVLSWKIQDWAKSGLTPWARIIDGRRWHVPTVTMSLHFTYTSSPFSWKGMTAIAKDLVKFWIGLFIVIRVIRDSRPDLLYVNEYSVVQASVAAAICRIPAVMHIRSLMLRGALGVRRRLVSRLVLKCNRAVFPITRLEAEQLNARADVREKIQVVGEFFPSLLDRSVDQKGARSAFGIPEGKKVVTMLGGIRDIKGSIDFLRSAGCVATTHPDALFVLAGRVQQNGSRGDRMYYRECMALVEQLQQKGSLVMLGEITNPLDLVAESDILISPSPQTHFSRPVIEAWGFAKPVVAARTPHMEDLIADGVNGLLVEPGDVDALAASIRRLLDDGELRRRLGREGRNVVEMRFDAEKNLQTIADRCDAVTAGDGGRKFH